MVKTVAGLTLEQGQAVALSQGGTLKRSTPALNLHAIDVPSASAAAIQQALTAHPQVVRVEESKPRRVQALPNDTLVGSQWALPKIAWDQVYGAVSPTFLTTVAILDTGVNPAHNDLINSLAPGTSIIDASNGLMDGNGHGTWLAGIVAARTNNIDGIAGVAFNAVQVMPVKVLAADGTGNDDDIIAGVLWAADHGASVILMAFSNPGFSESLQEAIDYAWSRGVVLVAAVGNDNSGLPTFPGGRPRSNGRFRHR
jgi:subtilisin family serine protease